jgi:transcriptional regulator with GAF, ATPase, and Fis domain
MTPEEMKAVLAINAAIVSLQDKVQLLKIINEELKALIPFDSPGLFIVNEEEDYHYDLMVAHPDINNDVLNQSLASFIPEGKTPHKGTAVEEILKHKEAKIWNWKTDLIDKGLDHPHFPVMLEYNLIHAMACPLHIEGKTLGFFCINAAQDIYTENQLSIFSAVCDCIAIALSNIFSREEIRRREQEKAQLLEIAQLVASVTSRQELLKIIVEKVKPLFNFYDCGLFVLSNDGQTHTDWAAVSPEIRPKEWNQQIPLVSKDIPHKKSLIEWMMQTFDKDNYPIIFDFQELITKFPDYPQFKDTGVTATGYQECLTAKLQTSDKIIGFFCINVLQKDFFRKEQFPLFQSVAHILSIAVANILANQDLANKSLEIEKLNKQLELQKNYLIKEVEEQYNFEEIIGENEAVKEVYRNISLVAKTDSTVLILGETGTGKELIARAIHNHSERSSKPLVRLNCATLPPQLIESELFGHERGAFTGAVERRIGKFEIAQGSTLFLDEIGELPLELQAKLLRVLQEKEIERLGSNKIIPIDVRIIAATNRDLLAEIQNGRFRQDLFYRLHIFPLHLPPLRERKEDIPLLAIHFLKKYTKKTGRGIEGFEQHVIEELKRYSWPGNIRELEHIIERSVIVCKGYIIKEVHLPEKLKEPLLGNAPVPIVTWKEQERKYLLEVLKYCQGRIHGEGGAAELLDLPPSTLQSKMQKLGIKRKHIVEE